MSPLPKPYNWENNDLLGRSVKSLCSFFLGFFFFLLLFNDLRQPKCVTLERRKLHKVINGAAKGQLEKPVLGIFPVIQNPSINLPKAKSNKLYIVLWQLPNRGL